MARVKIRLLLSTTVAGTKERAQNSEHENEKENETKKKRKKSEKKKIEALWYGYLREGGRGEVECLWHIMLSYR